MPLEKELEKEIEIKGIPKYIPELIAEECRTKISDAVRDLLHRSGMKKISISVGNEDDGTQPQRKPKQKQGDGVGDEVSIEQRAEQYRSREPLFGFDFLVVPDVLSKRALELAKQQQRDDLIPEAEETFSGIQTQLMAR